MDVSVGLSVKRRKLSNELNKSASASSSQIKHEELESALSSLPVPLRTLVTSGSKFYSPLPKNCQKYHPDYRKHRNAWLKREIDVLKSFGLKAIRTFVREDGMAIDWTSPTPVWADTLLPERPNLAFVIQRAHAANDQPSDSMKKRTIPLDSELDLIRPSTLTTIPSSKQLPRPPRPSSLPSAARVSGPTAMNRQAAILPSPAIPDQVSERPSQNVREPIVNRARSLLSVHNAGDTRKLRNFNDLSASTEPSPIPRRTPNHVNPAFVPETVTQSQADELQEATLGFLRKYIKIFDDDRSDLASAYSRSALFSYRVHERASAANVPHSSRAHIFAPKLASRDTSGSRDDAGIKQNRLEIVAALLSLGSSHKFCSSGVANVEYDLVILEPANDVLLICYTEIVDSRQNHRLSVDQTFILRYKEHDEEDRMSEGLWPLVAISHQMIIRDLSQWPSRCTREEI